MRLRTLFKKSGTMSRRHIKLQVRALLGFKKRKHKEWISTRTLEYVKQRKATKNKISQTISERQKGRLRVQYTELNKLQLCGEKRQSRMPVKDKHGKLLTSEQEQDKRWTDNFSPDIPPAPEDIDISVEPTHQTRIPLGPLRP
ncbi:hypothetical protein OS493_038986 [Desmophyllum pertusum]|uniref:Uncharacterized protein n=1 Tax=Desmophyllum pertusum TaxID=174260 RepID=A0A9W9Z5S8_9CNID|nr:hypothetical protein OS493_038986 [Desmophyllum pertusum]